MATLTVELRKFKHAAALSHETEAISAEIWINGLRAGSIENSGRGACHDLRWLDPRSEDVLADHCAALPKVSSDGFELEVCVDLFFSILIDEKITEKLNRAREKKLLKRVAKARAAGMALIVADHPETYGVSYECVGPAANRDTIVKMIEAQHGPVVNVRVLS